MTKTSSIEKNKKRRLLAKRFQAKRERLKAQARDENVSPEERFQAQLKSPSCRAIPRRHASATAARSPAARGATTAS